MFAAKNLVISTVIAASLGVHSLSVEDVSRGADEFLGVLPSVVYTTVEDKKHTAPKTVGLFARPSVFIPPATPTNAALNFNHKLRGARNKIGVIDAGPNRPFWKEAAQSIVLPNVNSDGIVYGQTYLRHINSNIFEVTNSPQIAQGVSISAANYRAGTLVITSLRVGRERFTNLKMQLNSQGRFELVEVYRPIEVKPSSYENYHSLPFGDQVLPNVVGKYRYMQAEPARAFADFMQNGTYVYFGTANQISAAPNKKEPSAYGFYRKRQNGEWENVTELLVNKNPATGKIPVFCAWPRQAAVNDFNGDRIPDIVVACSGSEHPDVPQAQRPENSMIILSTIDGRYDVKEFESPFKQAHAVAAYDFSGQGYADIVIADMGLWERPDRQPLGYFKNDRGTFINTPEKVDFLKYKFAFNVDIIPFNNSLYLYASGPDTEYYGAKEGLNASFFEYSGGRFSQTPKYVIPTLEQQEVGKCKDKSCFNHNLGVTVNGNKLLLNKVTTHYENYAVVEFDPQRNTTRYVYKHDGTFFTRWPAGGEFPACDGVYIVWLDFIRIHNGVALTDSTCTSQRRFSVN